MDVVSEQFMRWAEEVAVQEFGVRCSSVVVDALKASV